MKNELQELQNYVDEMKATSSGNDKKVIIEKYLKNEFVAKALIYENSPFMQFNVTSKSILKNPSLMGPDNNYTDVFSLLDDLTERNITGHSAIEVVNKFCFENLLYKDLILNLIDKDLKTRAGASLINKVKPKHIPTFDVALATKYEPEFCDFENEAWYASRKLDGLRCIVIVDGNGKASAWSRAGKQFETLGKVIEGVEKLNVTNVVFDGEICIVDENGDEDFTAIQKLYKKKDFTIPNPKYIIFDMLTTDEFNDKTSTRTLSERHEVLLNTGVHTYSVLGLLGQIPLKNTAEFDEWQEKAKDGNWEGFMVRRDTTYKGKRSKELLKVKKFSDAEYKVIRIESGPFRTLNEGVEVEEIVLSNVIIEHKGYEVSVGSGFSLDERRKFHNNPNEIVGQEITVQYFEETTNKQGTISLRFPTVKAIYKGGRDC
jgi:DNA ligase 1